MPSLLRRSVAEGLGTFALVFFSCGAAAVAPLPGAGYGLLGVALVNAVVYGVMLTATIGISGGYLNPAISLALLSVRRIDLRTTACYVVAQLIGAVLGAYLLTLVLPASIARIGTLGTPMLGNAISYSDGIVLEAVFTFFLASAVFGAGAASDGSRGGGVAVGLVLFFGMMVGGTFTGAAMNPARAFAPALVGHNWFAQPVWWIGPIVGGIVAAQLWGRVILKK
jgi:aquaporin Z